MPSISDLEAAGRRAATQPVPPAPDPSLLSQGAGRHRAKRRAVIGSLAFAGVVAIGVPVALSLQQDSGLEIVAAGTGDAAEANTLTDEAGDATAVTDDTAGDHDGSTNIDLRYGDDFALSIEVLHGPEAAAAADAAAAAADETQQVDEVTVWIDRNGDTTTVSALPEPEIFVAVTGPSDHVDKLLDAIGNGAWELPDFERGEGFDGDIEKFFDEFGLEDFGVEGFDLDGTELGPLLEQFLGEDFDPQQFLEQLEGLEGLEGFEGLEGELPELGPFFEQFFGEDFDPQQFLEQFEGLEGFDGLEGELPNFAELFENFDGELPDLEKFFEEGGLGGFGAFDGCFSIRVEGTDDDFTLDIPEGCNG